MGKRGPKRTPTDVLRARGSWRANCREGEPKSSLPLPAAPADQSREAQRLYRKVKTLLADMGMGRAPDQFMVVRYCRYLQDWAAADKRFRDLAACSTIGEEGSRAETVAKFRDGINSQLMKIENLLGFNPSARAGLRAEAETETEGEGDQEKPENLLRLHVGG